MATTYNNNGPIYLTQARYDAKMNLGEINPGQEYRITDWEAQEKLPDVPTTENATYVLKATVADGVVTYNWVKE